MEKFRRFCFTINNFNEEDVQNIINLPSSYTIYGLETGENGTPHIQGYSELKQQTRFNTLKKLLPRAHIEKCKGTAEQNIAYCKKENKFIELGEKKKQGERVDLEMIKKECLEIGMKTLLEKRTLTLHQIRTAETYLKYLEKPRNWKPFVTWIFGPSGSGKSKMARELTTNAYTKNEGSKWWEGYDMHKCVIIDDFRDSWWSITEMLRLLDRYECKIECKNGSRQFVPEVIIITSIVPPQEHYQNAANEPIKQLMRRVDKIIELKDSETVSEVEIGNTSYFDFLGD